MTSTIVPTSKTLLDAQRSIASLDDTAIVEALMSQIKTMGLNPRDVMMDRSVLLDKLKAIGVSKLGQRLRVAKMLEEAAQQPEAPATLDDLSASQCTSLLRELLEAYQEPAFQSKLRALQALPTGAYMQRLGPLVLTAQAPLLSKFGLAPDASGVEAMKMAIHRRIAEGNRETQQRLEGLANENRRVLGLAPLPDTRSKASCEELLADTLNEEAAEKKEGGGLSADEVRQKTRAARKGAHISAQNARLLERRLAEGVDPVEVRTLLCMAESRLAARVISGDDLRADPALFRSVPVLTSMPTAERFLTEHVLPSRPAVLRGLVDAERWPPLRNFPDFGYLRQRCGHRRVLVKSLAIDDTRGRPVFVSDPELKLPLVAFLEAVEAAESKGERCPFYLGKVPLNAELPELADDLRKASSSQPGLSPADALASCFGPLIPKGLFTYFGCDGNVTATHFDRSENLMLCVCGTKRLWLYPPSEAGHLYPMAGKDGSRAAAPPFQSYEQLPAHLKATFGRVAGAHPVEVNLVAGDFLYLPACWWHCVEGSKERNMIINWWMELHPRKRALDNDDDESVACT